MNADVDPYRRSIVCAVLAFSVWLAVAVLAPNRCRRHCRRALDGEHAGGTDRFRGRAPLQPRRARDGFALLGGWVLLGAVLFRQGRRRLARIGDGRHTERPSVRETTPQETTTHHDRGSGPATQPGRGDEPSRTASAG